MDDDQLEALGEAVGAGFASAMKDKLTAADHFRKWATSIGGGAAGTVLTLLVVNFVMEMKEDSEGAMDATERFSIRLDVQEKELAKLKVLADQHSSPEVGPELMIRQEDVEAAQEALRGKVDKEEWRRSEKK